MYVCMYVCMCVCMCMYVCMFVCMYTYVYVCVYVCIRMYVCMYTCMCVYMCVCMYVCMNVYMCVRTHVHVRLYVGLCCNMCLLTWSLELWEISATRFLCPSIGQMVLNVNTGQFATPGSPRLPYYNDVACSLSDCSFTEFTGKCGHVPSSNCPPPLTNMHYPLG